MDFQNHLSDTALLSAISNGEEEAFAILFDRYKHRLYIFVWQLIHSAADAEEIVQESFLKVWQQAGAIAVMDEPGHYIYTIARNKTLNHIRSMVRDQRRIQAVWELQKEVDDSLEEKLKLQDCKNTIERALQELSPNKQTIYRLSREEHLTHDEIAARLNLSKSRVKNMMVEILHHLRTALGEEGYMLVIILGVNWYLYHH